MHSGHSHMHYYTSILPLAQQQTPFENIGLLLLKSDTIGLALSGTPCPEGLGPRQRGPKVRAAVWTDPLCMDGFPSRALKIVLTTEVPPSLPHTINTLQTYQQWYGTSDI